MSIAKGILAGLDDALAHAKGHDTQVRETLIQVPKEVDVRAIRERLNLSQERFAIRYGFSVGAVRHWEQGRRHPEGPVRAYLKVIQHDHEAVDQALTA